MPPRGGWKPKGTDRQYRRHRPRRFPGSADQTIRVWSVADGQLLRSLDNHLGPVHALAVRPGRAADESVTLASASGDGTVRVWQPTVGRQVRIVRHPSPVFTLSWDHS